jgi:hypothetical protein
MSGHNVGRKRTWPWVVLSALFALVFIWSFAEQNGDVWSIVRIGSAIGSGLCLLRLILLSVSSRRLRRAQADGGRAEGDEGAEGPSSEEQPPTEEGSRTYEEVFGLQQELEGDRLPPSPEDEEWRGDERAEIEPEGEPWAEQPPAEEQASTSEADAQAPDADGGSEEHLRRIREEFRARAEEAALRVQQREAELHEVASVADQER